MLYNFNIECLKGFLKIFNGKGGKNEKDSFPHRRIRQHGICRL